MTFHIECHPNRRTHIFQRDWTHQAEVFLNGKTSPILSAWYFFVFFQGSKFRMIQMDFPKWKMMMMEGFGGDMNHPHGVIRLQSTTVYSHGVIPWYNPHGTIIRQYHGLPLQSILYMVLLMVVDVPTSWQLSHVVVKLYQRILRDGQHVIPWVSIHLSVVGFIDFTEKQGFFTHMTEVSNIFPPIQGTLSTYRVFS